MSQVARSMPAPARGRTPRRGDEYFSQRLSSRQKLPSPDGTQRQAGELLGVFPELAGEAVREVSLCPDFIFVVELARVEPASRRAAVASPFAAAADQAAHQCSGVGARV